MKKLLPLEETETLRPQLMYPVIKYLSEEYFRSQYNVFDLDITCIRLFELYSSKQDYFIRQPTLLGYLIKSLLLGEIPTLYASREAKRDYVFIDDLVEFIVLLLMNSRPKSFSTPNFGSGKAYSVYELVERLEDISGRELNYQTGSTSKFW